MGGDAEAAASGVETATWLCCCDAVLRGGVPLPGASSMLPQPLTPPPLTTCDSVSFSLRSVLISAACRSRARFFAASASDAMPMAFSSWSAYLASDCLLLLPGCGGRGAELVCWGMVPWARLLRWCCLVLVVGLSCALP